MVIVALLCLIRCCALSSNLDGISVITEDQGTVKKSCLYLHIFMSYFSLFLHIILKIVVYSSGEFDGIVFLKDMPSNPSLGLHFK